MKPKHFIPRKKQNIESRRNKTIHEEATGAISTAQEQHEEGFIGYK